MLDFFEQTGFHIPVTPVLVFIVMAVLFIAWGVYSWVVRYHWKHYGTGKLEVMSMSFFYFVGSAILLALVATFAFLYQLSSGA